MDSPSFSAKANPQRKLWFFVFFVASEVYFTEAEENKKPQTKPSCFGNSMLAPGMPFGMHAKWIPFIGMKTKFKRQSILAGFGNLGLSKMVFPFYFWFCRCGLRLEDCFSSAISIANIFKRNLSGSKTLFSIRLVKQVRSINYEDFGGILIIV